MQVMVSMVGSMQVAVEKGLLRPRWIIESFEPSAKKSQHCATSRWTPKRMQATDDDAGSNRWVFCTLVLQREEREVRFVAEKVLLIEGDLKSCLEICSLLW